MKILLLTITALLICNGAHSQNNPKTREVCIIATTHDTNDFCNPQILDSILQVIEPDLILVEMDSTFFTTDFYYDTISRPYLIIPESSSVETITTHIYKKEHPEVDIRPYDISMRNDYYRQQDYFNMKPAMYQDIFRYTSGGSNSERDYRDFMLLAVSLHCINNLNITSLAEMNAETTSSLTFLQNMVYMNSAINLTESIDSIRKYQDFAKWQKDFWETRNAKMIDNIISVSEGYERIVVLTGNLHKYYLVMGLSADHLNIKLKEFWEY
ncbi:MAG TPA: hypothetical protein ENN08_02295 [Bacteroidales bacterium]|nr:hypothetical protein [Bacteroidales bacterium]